jgi:SAM-dependent methyltransferase
VKEQYYEELLNIRTIGNKSEVNNSTYYHPYEPTPYSALEELSKHYEVTARDHIVDFGCGKGRLNFYLNYSSHAVVTGIEMNEDFYQAAMKNKMSYIKKGNRQDSTIRFHCCKAEQYEIQRDDNRFYFFNPFSIQIFMRVINNILRSVELSNREVDLILYYASDDYRYFLENQTSFNLLKEIELPGLYDKNTYERFLIYRLG